MKKSITIIIATLFVFAIIAGLTTLRCLPQKVYNAMCVIDGHVKINTLSLTMPITLLDDKGKDTGIQYTNMRGEKRYFNRNCKITKGDKEYKHVSTKDQVDADIKRIKDDIKKGKGTLIGTSN